MLTARAQRYAREVATRRGMGDGVASAVLAGVGPITVGSAFPPFEYQYDPTQPSAPAQTKGGWLANWLTTHVLRPYVDVGGLYRYDPAAASGAADYSGIAAVATVGAGIGLAATAAWVLIRAFSGRGS